MRTEMRIEMRTKMRTYLLRAAADPTGWMWASPEAPPCKLDAWYRVGEMLESPRCLSEIGSGVNTKWTFEQETEQEVQ